MTPHSDALQLRGISKSFDGFKALVDADFTLQWGEVHGLLGENGAGKSSLMNIAAGLYLPESGRVLVDGRLVRLSGPRDAASHHIGMVHQHFKLVKPLSAAENVMLGHAQARAMGSHRQRLRLLEERIEARAASLGFEIDPRRRVEQMSIAEQQRVEIMKVLLAGAKIIIFDEPTAVLTDKEAERLLETMNVLSRQDAAVVLVTHKMADVKMWADRATVMRAGRTVATLDPKRTSEQEMVELAVGQSVSSLQSAPASERGNPLLSVSGLRMSRAGRRVLDGVDLTLHAGQIYGLAGVGGNGQSELAEALMGIADDAAGRIELVGAGDWSGVDVARRRDHCFAMVPADRYGLALAGDISVVENFCIGQIRSGRYGSAWRLDHASMAADAQDAVKAFDVHGVRHLAQRAALLSGGNAQKLVLAREFALPPRLVLAHSPSRGLDVRAGAAVHACLRKARAAGAAVLLISEDLDEVLALSDRIGVMTRGRIVAEFEQPSDRQAIGKVMVN